MSTKNDKPTIDFNLDAIEIPDEARSYRFPFKGKQLQTIDLSTMDYMRFEKAWSAYRQTENPRTLLDLILGDDAKRFWELKPTLWQVMGLVNHLEPIFEAVFGSPGESEDSSTL